MAIRRTFIDSIWGQLHLRVAGQPSQRPPIVCLHMVPKSSRSFANLMEVLAQDRLVIAPDYPGYGESDPPPVEPHVSISDYAKSVWQVVDHFNLQQVNFVGYHTGAMVAVEAAQYRPADVAKVINISAPLFTPQEVKNFLEYYSPVPLDIAGQRFRLMWERIMQYRGPGMTLEMAAVSMAENLRAGENYEWGHNAAFNHAEAYTDNLKQLRQPLFVMNINDDLYEHSRRVDPLLKNGYRKDFPDWGAGFLDVFTEQAAAVMKEFFDTEDL